jgi:hypothetical protein
VELDPQDSIAAENLLVCYIALNRMADAKAELTRALNIPRSLLLRLTQHFVRGWVQPSLRDWFW